VDQHALTTLKLGAGNQIVEDRKEILRKSGGLEACPILRNRQDLNRWDRTKLAVAAAGEDRTHAVTGLPFTGIRGSCGDGPGNVEPRDPGYARRWRIFAETLVKICSRHACGFDPNQYLARTGNGNRDVDGPEDLRTPGFGDFNGEHNRAIMR
jgi:hypothetical protein